MLKRLAFYILAATMSATHVLADDLLTGDTKLACEAILCLSTGAQPSECAPSLARYFGISFSNFSDTLQARFNFLQLCPVSNQTPEMQSLVQAIANGAGRCDASGLNFVNRIQIFNPQIRIAISDRMPDFCEAYLQNSYTDFEGTMPRYVGTPYTGGYWVEAAQYDQELAKFKALNQAGFPANRNF